MYDVFISYRRESGSEMASILHQFLEQKGYSVFFDAKSLRAGEFEPAIDNAIDQCTYFLLLLTQDTFNRSLEEPDTDWILHESKRAIDGIDSGKVIIPIKIVSNAAFPADTGNDIIEKLSKSNICDISGVNAASLIETKLLSFLTKKDELYNKGVADPDYLDWELKTLKSIYSDIPFVTAFGKEYPAYVVKGSPDVKYPFDSLTRCDDLLPCTEAIPYKDSPHYDEFRRIVGPNIHYPDLYGFTSRGFKTDSDGCICGILSTPRTYKETVFSCHILQYELWKAYNSIGAERLATLDDLPMRRAIHGDRSNIDVIMSGCNRSALNDVTIAVIDYNDEAEEYQIAYAKRNESVATYPNFFGFVPSGGFELYELENNQSSSVIAENYSVKGALYREYIEELFGDCNFEQATGDDDLNRLYKNEKIRNLRQGVRSGDYKFEFLGVDFDLVTLRQTLAFVLRIDDANYYFDNVIRKNNENDSVKFVSLKHLEEQIIENRTSVMCETAATYALLKKNHLFKEMADNDFRLIQ